MRLVSIVSTDLAGVPAALQIPGTDHGVVLDLTVVPIRSVTHVDVNDGYGHLHQGVWRTSARWKDTADDSYAEII